MNPSWKQRLLPPVIILGCGLAAGALISLGGQAEKTPPEVTPTLVLVQTLVPEDTTALVQATGVVQPARQVTIVPQVAGKVEEVSAQLVPGGRVSQGDLLAMIEQRDYLAAHAQAQSQLRQAELELALERGRATTAKREWDMLHSDGKAPRQSSLALREPHLEVAKARVRAAQAAVRQAEANISRTRLRAPFTSTRLRATERERAIGPRAPREPELCVGMRVLRPFVYSDQTCATCAMEDAARPNQHDTSLRMDFDNLVF